jgi:hypothetical protein
VASVGLEMGVSAQLCAPAAALSAGKLPASQAHEAASTPQPALKWWQTEVLAIQPLVRETAETATTSVRTHSVFDGIRTNHRANTNPERHRHTRPSDVKPYYQTANLLGLPRKTRMQTNVNRNSLIYANKLE